jgi:hypothetical protein
MENFMKLIKSLFIAALLQIICSSAFAAKLDVSKIEKIVGIKGDFNEKEKVLKISYPRKDVKVNIAGVKANPAMGLTTWAAFTKTGNHVMVMGDIVMTEGQVNKVMDIALDSGLEVTALHNHFFADSPKIMFMHIGGMGDEEKLAIAVGKVFMALKNSTNEKFPAAKIDPTNTTLSPQKIYAILGKSGVLKDGVYKVVIGRTTKMMGYKMGNTMGVNTWAAFIGSDEKAVVDGDFAMLESELQGVLKALRKSNINIVAIHNHMTTENPRIIFLHFWGIGSATELANGIKAALDTQKN